MLSNNNNNNNSGCNDVSFGDHNFLEGDRIPPLKSHGQALEEELCFPGVLSHNCDAPANLLLHLWLSHATHLLFLWQTDRRCGCWPTWCTCNNNNKKQCPDQDLYLYLITQTTIFCNQLLTIIPGCGHIIGRDRRHLPYQVSDR